ncbi:MAG: TetR/AcrR family transcriptional regulator C-terminal domain-containing protein [Chloroflexota bacterium]|nr:TetR/AcrR family transcriptional regulator C-terminal domain-containing protein [Chloroflexota bacterium]
MGRRTGRPKAGQERLGRDVIVAAALRLIDEQGMAALSMRKLAAELGVDPMAIYHHLPGKAAVLAALVEDVFSRLRVPPASGEGWQDRVRAFARAYRDVVRSHPNLVRHVVASAEVAATAVLEASEELYAALMAAGLGPVTVVRAADLVVDYVHGFALAEAAGPLEPSDGHQEILTQLGTRPAAEFPAMSRILGSLREEDLRADFGFGLDVILAGIEAFAGRTSDRGGTDGTSPGESVAPLGLSADH